VQRIDPPNAKAIPSQPGRRPTHHYSTRSSAASWRWLARKPCYYYCCHCRLLSLHVSSGAVVATWAPNSQGRISLASVMIRDSGALKIGTDA
jgi:hypothetical protein